MTTVWTRQSVRVPRYPRALPRRHARHGPPTRYRNAHGALRAEPRRRHAGHDDAVTSARPVSVPRPSTKSCRRRPLRTCTRSSHPQRLWHRRGTTGLAPRPEGRVRRVASVCERGFLDGGAGRLRGHTRSSVSTHTPTVRAEILRVRNRARVAHCELREGHSAAANGPAGPATDRRSTIAPSSLSIPVDFTAVFSCQRERAAFHFGADSTSPLAAAWEGDASVVAELLKHGRQGDTGE